MFVPAEVMCVFVCGLEIIKVVYPLRHTTYTYLAATSYHAGADAGSPAFSASSPCATSGGTEAEWAATPLAPPAGEEAESPADGLVEDLNAQ